MPETPDCSVAAGGVALARGLVVLALVAALSLDGTCPAGAGVLVLSTYNDPPNATADHTGVCDLILTEAVKRLGLALEIVNLPAERALIEADSGRDDGTFARVEGMERQYPNLIRVAEPITTFEFVAHTAGAAFTPAGWESLRPYHVGIITGWKILENNITGAASLTRVRDDDLLFGLLAAGRVDVAVYDRRQGLAAIRRLGLRGIAALEPPLAVRPMYPYLHRRHAGLVPALERALRGMRADGTLRRITVEAQRRLGAGD